MTVAEIIAEIERCYPCEQGIFAPVCNTGAPYASIGTPKHGRRLPASLPGTIPPGERHEVWKSEAEACARFMEAFNRYASACDMLAPQGAKPVLYWRYAAPHVFMEYSSGNGKRWSIEKPIFPTLFFIRARLCISPNPVVWKSTQEYDAALKARTEDTNGEEHIQP